MIYVDDRSGSCDLLDIEPVRSNCEKCRLESADAMIIGNGPDDTTVLVGVEVKSIWDLVSSINTGRLQATQATRMLSEDGYHQRWILYYGGYSAGNKGELRLRKGAGWRTMRLGSRVVPYGYVESMLVELATIGFNIKHCHDIEEAAVWLGVLHRWWSKPWSAHKGMRTFDNSREMSLMPGMDADMLIRAKVAAALPGVGFERAIAAARHFPSVSAMVNATSADWERVPGIGRVIAKAVIGAIR